MSGLQSILNPILVKQLVNDWLIEDQPAFDLQSLACCGKRVEAVIDCKTPGALLAGVPFVDTIAQQLDVQIQWDCAEGDVMYLRPVHVATLTGKAEHVLKMERLALNILARCSGIATTARRLRNKLNLIEWNGILAGTRKTTPGFRLPEKYSLLVGGVSQHRFDLSHMVMLKDNHVTICGSVKEAVARVKSVQDFASKIEVECSCESEAVEALDAGADIIMLDNFEPENLKQVSTRLKSMNSQCLIEASGGISESRLHLFALPSVDIISMGSLVQGYQTTDLSLTIARVL